MIQPEIPIVSCANHPSRRWLFAFVLVALAAFAVPVFAQQKSEEPSHTRGYVEDWSSHHVGFSNPGAEPDVRERDKHDRWLRIVNDERYMMQQRRRSAPRRWGGWGHNESSIQRDWSMLIGTATAPSASGTFASEPNTGSTLTITAGLGTLELQAGAATAACALVSGTTYEGTFVRSFTASTDATNLAALINTAGCGNLVGVTASHTGSAFTITATGPGQEEVGTAASDSIQLTSSTASGTNFNLNAALTNTALTGGTGMNPNAFPAKYNQDYAGEAASCSDYIVFPTGVAGASSQATIIGYKNLYKTTCTSNSGPDVAFAYNTGGGASTLSPVLSGDGKQIAYIQTVSGVASLVLLKPSLTSGSTVMTLTAQTTAALYNACTAPCFYAITLNGSPNDTNSSPFYTYTSTGVADTLYVGDDSGKVHKFNPVFGGAPAEITTNWPAAATTSVSTNKKLASPVYDSGGSGLVFVTDATGYLNSISAGTTPGTALTSNQMECGTFGFVDAPVVDSSNEYVYVFVGDGCSDGTAPVYSSYVNVFAAGTSINGSYGHNNAQFGNQATNSIGTVQYHGMFDNAFYESAAGAFGNLYACVNGELFQIPMSTFSGTTQVALANSAYDTPASTVSDAATCSGVTEYCNHGSTACTVSGTTHKTSAGTDYLFFSLVANGSTVGTTNCTNGCILNYDITSGATTGNPSDALQAAGGTTSIVIDNSGSATGESQVYFGSLSSETCAGNGTVGSGTGSCAVQGSQSALQ
jgi:hypothetical protein